MNRTTRYLRRQEVKDAAFDSIVLAHDERHLRRKVLTLRQGEEVLVDLADAVVLAHGDVLVLEDGRMAAIVAAKEALYAVTGCSPPHLTEIAWHLGNRHLPAQIEKDRIVILRDHVIKAMLEGLGATVTEIEEPFQPIRGAYHAHAHTHTHASDHHHRHDHSHTARAWP
jgi:urease accessory protein